MKKLNSEIVMVGPIYKTTWQRNQSPLYSWVSDSVFLFQVVIGPQVGNYLISLRTIIPYN
jgi:hypothetical protein